MKSEIADVRQTLTYGHSHDLARSALPFTLFVILLGLFVITPLDGSELERGHALLGGIVVAFAIAFFGVIIYRRVLPSVPSIVLSPAGVLFRDVSDNPIPWNEIREVGIAEVRRVEDFTDTKVTKLVVSKSYFHTLTRGALLDSVIGHAGNPSEIYLSYYHAPPFDEFREATLRRWHEFSIHARGEPFPETAEVRAAPLPDASRSSQPEERRAVSRRASSFEGSRALGALIRSSSPAQLVAIAASLAGIAALLTNQMGFWSTAAQERGRAKAAEWRAWQQKYDADLQATDEEQRRNREMWERTFDCMEQQGRGGGAEDPDCMKEPK